MNESSQSESENELNDSFESDQEFDSDYENYSSSINEEEDNLNASRGRKRMRLLTDSGDDSEESNDRKILKLLLMEQFGKRSKQIPLLTDHLFIRQLWRLFAFKRKDVKRHLLVEIGIHKIAEEIVLNIVEPELLLACKSL
ncbi:hypothetical protein AVEN_148511-1 [Araneus ventricosus]|uniref:Uncharacterized protein n=1 Tax=Araneus ventricosus TaxID=182803 RepID=A0A4Y2JUX1_ARAVE|nr:hypothetical protein AVEN_148511-1 [Araneus ventricosus]